MIIHSFVLPARAMFMALSNMEGCNQGFRLMQHPGSDTIRMDLSTCAHLAAIVMPESSRMVTPFR